jgi:hypothetical protein
LVLHALILIRLRLGRPDYRRNRPCGIEPECLVTHSLVAIPVKWVPVLLSQFGNFWPVLHNQVEKALPYNIFVVSLGESFIASEHILSSRFRFTRFTRYFGESIKPGDFRERMSMIARNIA